MLRDSVARRLRETRSEGAYLFPAYDDYCFTNVQGTAFSVLGESLGRRLPDDVLKGVDADVERVLVVLIDGFGYEQWKRHHRDHPFLATLTERGRVTPLTSTYPSETAAAMTTFTTGLLPVEHGVLGWYQYVEALDAVVQTLPFATVDGRPVEETIDGASRGVLFPQTSLYERAAARGIDVHLVQPEGILDPQDSALLGAGIEPHPYRTVAGMAIQLRRVLEAAKGGTYVHAYLPAIDATAHAAGTDSRAYGATLSMIADRLRTELIDRLDGEAAEGTLLIVAADHGHVDTDPTTNLDLSTIDGIRERLRTDGRGEPIPPIGGPRNLRFHVQSGAERAVRDVLERELDARVFDRAEALDRRLFGDAEPIGDFDERCGELICVPRERGVWWDGHELDFVGMHGGLHPDEMLAPFAAANLAALR
ncbi:alkaline phosphatase family protein [Halalkalicoccus ordinarius]|uniref:alkaline phosphatase family protein n=1 Tax=Halalkalicoccus ordinarius TaxID=3116651 RepID=UPI00300EB8DA